jgi:uncharacterized protein YciI
MAQYAFVVLKYLVPLERIQQTVDRHRAYLGGLHAQGKLVASGPLVPRTGGGLLFRVADDAELSQLLAADPFQQEGLVEATRFHWAPGIGVEGLDRLAPAGK